MKRALPFLALLVLAVAPAAAYTPGTGNLYSDDFEGTLDPDWEQGNGFGGNPSPWTQQSDGLDTSFNADGVGPFFPSASRHWARHFVHPSTATTFSIALEYRAELGPGYHFHLDVEQRGETPRKYRLRIGDAGAVTLWRSETATLVQVAATADGTVPVDTKRWIRLAVEPDPSGHPRVRIRVWSGSATAEPASWTIDFLDDLDTLQRVHRFELEADGPAGVDTWVDDLDVWGDPGNGVASSVTDVYVAELSHLDIGFTEPPDDIEQFAKTHLDQVLANLSADSAYRWQIESGWFLEQWWERSTDAERTEMLDRLREGRLALAAGYANQTTTMLGHEQLIRNLYYSTRVARENGFAARTWITDDVPGTSFAVPEILARAGVDYFVGGMNTGFGGRVDEPDHGDRPFWWVGPDGSCVLSWITFDSYAEGFQYGFSFFDNLAAMWDKLGQKLPELEEAGYDYPELMLLRGFDNHYQGFHVRNLIDQWNATYQTPVFHLATPEEFLDLMLARYGGESFPSYSGDFGAAWARSRAATPHTTRLIREAHRDARVAEALLAAGAAVDGQPLPVADIERMYRKLLTSDEHTGAGGWPGYFTPEEMDRNNRIHLGYAQDAAATAAMLVEQGLDRATAEVPAAGDAVIVVNALGRPRDAWTRVALPPALYGGAFRVVEAGGGAEVVYQRFDATNEILFRAEAVPGFGYRVFDLLPGDPTAVPGGTLTVSADTLENDFYVLTVDATDGSVSSLVDRASGRQLVDPGAGYDFNELASSTKAQYDAQAAPTAEPPSSASVTIGAAGPLVAELEVTRSGTPHVETVYRLYRNDDRVEIENVLDRDLMPYVPQAVSVRAYYVTMPFDVHDFEIRSETTTRFLDPVGDAFPRGSVFDWHNAEHTLAFHDADLGVLYAVDAASAHHFENLSSLTSASYSTGDALLLSRLLDRSDEYRYEDDSIGPYEVEPDTGPIHRFVHHLRATPPAFDPLTASRFGFEALTPAETRLIGRRPGNLPSTAASLFRVDPPEVLGYTAKPASVGSGAVLRVMDLTGAGAAARVGSDVLALSGGELVEQDEEGGAPLAPDGDGFLVTLGAYETRTVRVGAAPGWSPIVLTLDKNAGAGTVELSWSEGVTPYTVERAEDPGFTGATVLLVDEQDVTTHADPVLGDGLAYYYLVK